MKNTDYNRRGKVRPASSETGHTFFIFFKTKGGLA